MIPESFYVDVNINYQQADTVTGSVPMSALVSATATETKTYSSLTAVQSDYTTATAPELLASEIYFANGGKELLIYKQDTGVTDAQAITSLADSYPDIIWITFTSDKTSNEIQTIAATLSTLTTALPKYLAQTSNVEGLPTTLSNLGYGNVALLYSTETTITPYTAIAIPAYFSGIDLTEVSSLKSITFTKISGVDTSTLTSSTLTSLYSGNWNAVVNLANRYTIIDGGKMCDGQPIHSAWGFAIFKQSCENTISDLLIEKISYNNSSNALIENKLSSICSYFINNGLIGTDKQYNLDTQTVAYNNKTYTTITNGQVLVSGYYIYSIPISNASTADIASQKIPPVYIYAIIDDIIRLVTINGEVSK